MKTRRWISISESLPDEMTTVLVSMDAEIVTIGFLCDGEWEIESEKVWFPVDIGAAVTHWMPMPTPPIFDPQLLKTSSA